MNTVIATGCPHSGWEVVIPTLACVGLRSADAALSGWHDQVLAAAGVRDLLQLRGPLQPAAGMAEALAARWPDGAPMVAGSADSRSLWLLDFWAATYPDAKFLLFFTSAETAVARALLCGIEPDDFVGYWKAATRHLMQFQRRHRRRAMLLDAEVASRQSEAFIAASQLLGLSLPLPADWIAPANAALPEMARFLASRIVANDSSIAALEIELEARAQPLADSALPALEVTLDDLVKSYLQTLQDREQVGSKLQDVQEALERSVLEKQQTEAARQALEAANQSLEASRTEALKECAARLEQLHELQGELKSAVVRAEQLQQAQNATAAELQQLEARLAQAAETGRELEAANQSLGAASKEAGEENDLLLKQLHGVQEELERMVLEKQQLVQAQNATAAELQQLEARLAQAAETGRELEAANQSLGAASREAGEENDLLLKQLHGVQEELERMVLEKQQLVQAQKATVAELQQREARLAQAAETGRELEAANQSLGAASKEAGEENDRLLKQLHGVQEELERMLLEKQQLVQAQNATVAELQQREARLAQAAETRKELEAANQSLGAASKEAGEENDRLLKQLHGVQVELERMLLEKQQLVQAQKATVAELQQREARLAQAAETGRELEAANQSLGAASKEAGEENERLLKQLHGVQVELERMLLEKQQLVQAQKATVAELQQREARLAQAAETGRELEAANQSLGAASKEAGEENERLLKQLDDVQAELKSVGVQKQQLERTGKAASAEIHQLKAAIAEAEQSREQLKTSHLALELSGKEAREEIELLLRQIQEVQDELEHYFLKYQETRTRTEQVASEPAAALPELPPIEEKAQAAGQRKKTTAWTNHVILRSFIKPFKGPEKKQEKINRQAAVLNKSGLFDQQWYLSEYPDVASAAIDPVEHYLRFGAAEGRNPSPTFDTLYYLQTNPDVAAARVNPLLHYIEFGISEGRQPCG
jgi:chromosome segregation ATPase